jgi:N-formylglutamate deformylase
MQPRHLPGVLALHLPAGEHLPLLFDSPHSGTIWPEDFRPAAPEAGVRAAEDSFVHELFGAAPAHGACLLEALFPRAYVDVNRGLEDLDSELLAEPWPGPLAPGEKSALGKGLIWRLCPPGVPVYDRLLTRAEVERRIEDYYRPYHAALAETLDALHARHGEVFHVDCHSMKSVSIAMDAEGPGVARPDIVLGDRDGTSAEESLVALVREALESRGLEVALNHPFKGAEIVRLAGDPAAGRHSLQIEINRRLYMDERTRRPHDGFEQLRAILDGLIAQIAEHLRKRMGA